MPLLKRQPFVKSKPPPGLQPDDEVFFCEATKEIFTDYEKFFERVILCNSLVWSCEITGRSGLTYQEALECEQAAKKRLSSFPSNLQKPILFLATRTYRGRLNELNDDVFVFAKDRYFIGESVEVTQQNQKINCKVVQVIPPEEEKKTETEKTKPDSDADSDVICLDDSQPSTSEQTRKKGLFTRDKCKLYLKQNCEAIDGIWRVKERVMKRFSLRDAKFSSMFGGPMPLFEKCEKVARKKPGPKSGSKVKSPAGPAALLSAEDKLIREAKNEMRRKKRKERAEKKRKELEMEQEAQKIRAMYDKMRTMSAEEKVSFKEKMKQEKMEDKEKKKAESRQKWEEEKLKRKEERDKEREKRREEKKVKEELLKEWSKPRDDMECDDLKDMPMATPVRTIIPTELFGNAVFVLEYLNCFSTLFDIRDEFPDLISLEAFCKALQDTDSRGMYADLLRILLTAIFRMQDEEEEDCEDEEDSGDDLPAESHEASNYGHLIREAVAASQLPNQIYSMALRQLPVDPFTLSEVLRLHLLSSGATTALGNIRWQYQQRGGYTACDDPGLQLKRSAPGVMKALAEGNAFDLDPEYKLKILETLIHQLLTFVGCRDFIDDNIERIRGVKQDLRHHQWAEDRRRKEETTFWWKKRAEERAREKEMDAQKKEAKKKEKEERLIAEENDKEVKQPEKRSTRQQDLKDREEAAKDLPEKNIDWEKLTPEDREKMKAKYLKREMELNRLILDLQHGTAICPVGRDRTYRRFWVFKSVPGLFVEDHEEHISEECLRPVPQKDPEGNSDKENESFDSGKGHSDQDKSQTEKTVLVSEADVVTMSVDEQIAKRNQHQWLYYHSPQQMDALIDALNPRGLREGPLRQALIEQKALMVECIDKCPVNVLSISTPDEDKCLTQRFHELKSRNKKTQGYVHNGSAREFMELNLREMILDIEERIYHGTLGNLQVNDRIAWRDAIESGSYSTGCAMESWSKGFTIPNGDQPMEIEDDRPKCHPVVKDMAQAMMQIGRMIEQRYLQQPLGSAKPDRKKGKKRDEEAEEEDPGKRRDDWEASLRSASSLPQLFLHLAVLEKSVIWSKSALHARCRICRRKGDAEKMLLCDGCDRGHHMYCLKPAVKKVPLGDWYCMDCKPKEVVRTPRKRRRSVFEEEEEEEEESHASSESSQEEEDGDEDTEADTEEDEEEEEEETEEEEEEAEEEAPKIKLLSRKKPAASSSGRSTPTSYRSSGRLRASIEPTEPPKASRKSLEERPPSRNRRSTEPAKPPSRPSSRAGRLSLEPAEKRARRSHEPTASKRHSMPVDEESPESKKRVLSKSRNSEKTNVQKMVESLVDELAQRDEAWPFIKPVLRRDAPDYFDIIKKPMDFSTIRNKINRYEYSRPSDILEDARLVFRNCDQYNMPTTPEFQAGKKLSKFFEKRIKDLKIEVKVESVRTPVKSSAAPKRSARTK
ncbi:hypothetical protein CAPTEDRAFT_221184 [Capitella teleta]|uniref:Bromodomain adjacent to zinc finger domain protein 1A n=1 Tax=Capitella teleta TaxID=283909 RepID=R7TAW8_CAPTE|nr:hypothetical protein CAPTEDRAFT_221184 [Capitella teleta]|eukprot:ELT88139.1 hypothetical protein CAPTEDRAFT_221184 [Capitella teleta]